MNENDIFEEDFSIEELLGVELDAQTPTIRCKRCRQTIENGYSYLKMETGVLCEDCFDDVVYELRRKMRVVGDE